MTVHEALVTAVAMKLRVSRDVVEHALTAEDADMRPGTIFHSVRTSYQVARQVLLEIAKPNEKARAMLVELGIEYEHV